MLLLTSQAQKQPSAKIAKYENMIASTNFLKWGDEECEDYPKYNKDSMLETMLNDDDDDNIIRENFK